MNSQGKDRIFGPLNAERFVTTISFHEPNHNASDLCAMISRPEQFLNISIRWSSTLTEEVFLAKTVVSSAYCDNFMSCLPTETPFISGSLFIASASSSIAKTKSSPDSGQPCLTPCLSLKKGDAKPLFITLLDISM